MSEMIAPVHAAKARPIAIIQAEIDETVGRLRVLRAKQADAHFSVAAETAAHIKATQERLDRLYEEKRIAHAVQRGRPPVGDPRGRGQREPGRPRDVVARDLARQVFAD